MGRSREVALVADSPYAGVATAELFGERNPFEHLPKYDSRFARSYAINILRHGGYFAELAQEAERERRRGDSFRSDASGLSIAFARSLEYIIRQPYEAEYPELRATEFLPLMTEVPPEAATFTYRMLDKLGQAAIIQENGSDAPKVSLKGSEWQAPIVTVGASYDYTILDTLRAARLNIPLEAYKAEAARFACEYLLETIAAVGAANSGVAGFTNAPGINATTQVSTGGNWIAQIGSIGAASTSNATPPAVAVVQAIAADLAAGVNKVFVQTKGTHRPDTALTGYQAYGAIMTAPRSPGFTQDTVLDYLEDLLDLDIECWPQLDTAGAISTTYTPPGGSSTTYTGRVMVYKKDPKLLNLVLCQPFTQLPPQPIRMAWEVTTYLRTGGVTVRYPLTVTYIDGVS